MDAKSLRYFCFCFYRIIFSFIDLNVFLSHYYYCILVVDDGGAINRLINCTICVRQSTGIGEPLPVAQTFAMDIEEMTGPNGTNNVENAKLTVAEDEKKSLFHYAILDTLVTVVDALNIYDVLSSIETLADKENASGMVRYVDFQFRIIISYCYHSL